MSPTLMRGSEKCKLNVLLFSDLNFAKVLIDRLNMLMFLSVQGIRKYLIQLCKPETQSRQLSFLFDHVQICDSSLFQVCDEILRVQRG